VFLLLLVIGGMAVGGGRDLHGLLLPAKVARLIRLIGG